MRDLHVVCDVVEPRAFRFRTHIHMAHKSQLQLNAQNAQRSSRSVGGKPQTLCPAFEAASGVSPAMSGVVVRCLDQLRRYAHTTSDARTPAQQGDSLLDKVMHRRCHVVMSVVCKPCLLLPIEAEVVNKLNDILFEDAQPSTSYQQIPVFHFSVSFSRCRKPVMSTFCLQQIYRQITAETSEGLHQGQIDTNCTFTTSFGELSGSKHVFCWSAAISQCAAVSRCAALSRSSKHREHLLTPHGLHCKRPCLLQLGMFVLGKTLKLHRLC